MALFVVSDDDIGLKILREAPAEAVDIVAIHGIGAHPDYGWCKNVNTPENPRWVNWLDAEDMLPAVAPHARIMRYGYQSERFREGAMRQNTLTVAQRLLLALRRNRQERPFRPLLFIAHCLGGLIVLKALLDAQNDEIEWPGIFSSTIGLIFLGTPFRGTEGMSQIEILEAAQQEYYEDQIQSESPRMPLRQAGNEFLQDLVDQFGKTRRRANKAHITCFYEIKPSITRKTGLLFVVNKTSGCLDLSDNTGRFSLSRTHFNMNKFGHSTDEDFEIVGYVIGGMIEASRDLLLARSQSLKLAGPQPLKFRRYLDITAPNLIKFYEGADLQIVDRNVLPYKIIKSLGVGGCASVEMVEDITTGQVFAHKLFRRYHGPNLDGFRQEVQNEVKIMRRLSPHPHIISLFATYSCNRDFGMILTPVADDEDLATYLQKISDSGTPPTTKNCTVLVCAFGCLASGLAFIHKQTIRHKDIKPQNILIHQGRIIYTDFGIAFDATQQDSTTTTGRPNAFTRRYCAPEVASWAKRNRKSDIFSLGCVFIEILTILEPLLYSEHLKAPAYHEVIEDLRNDLNHKQTTNPHWSGLVRICANMLEPDIDHRISTEGLLTEMKALAGPEANSTLKYFCDFCSKGN